MAIGDRLKEAAKLEKKIEKAKAKILDLVAEKNVLAENLAKLLEAIQQEAAANDKAD